MHKCDRNKKFNLFLQVKIKSVRNYAVSKCIEFDEHKNCIEFTNTSFMTMNNVSCLYENQCGLAQLKSDENNDILVRFFHPSTKADFPFQNPPPFPKTIFQLTKNDTVWVQ